MKRPPGHLEREVERWSRGASRRPRPHPVGPGQESVWDYPRPPRVEPVGTAVRVEVGGQRVADTRACLRVLETASPPTYYIPVRDVHMEWLIRGVGASWCEWKGEAAYWDLVGGSRPIAGVAWSYPDPFEEYAALRDHLAFFAQRADACFVGESRVTPQPGRFYGGWVTPSLAGPFKGEPGSQGW